MTNRENSDFAFWLDNWTRWLGPAATGFPGWKVRPGSAATGSLGDLAGAYDAFAAAIQEFARGSGDGALGPKLADAIERMSSASELAEADSLLRTFLAAAPMSPFINRTVGSAAGDVSDELLDWQSRWLQGPAIGPCREWVDAGNELHSALIEQRRAEQKVAAHYREAVELAFGRFAEFLRDDSGEPVTSLKSLYDVWVEIAEAAYGEVVMSDTFAEDFSAWINSGSDARLKLRGLMERVGGVIDFPTRSDIDVLLERHKALSGEIASLRATIDELRRARPAGADRPHPRAADAGRPRSRKNTVRSATQGRKPAPPRRKTPAAGRPKPGASTGEFDISAMLPDRD